MRSFQLGIFCDSVTALLRSAGVCSALDLNTKLKLPNAAERALPLSSLLTAELVFPQQKKVFGATLDAVLPLPGHWREGGLQRVGPAWKRVGVGAEERALLGALRR